MTVVVPLIVAVPLTKEPTAVTLSSSSSTSLSLASTLMTTGVSSAVSAVSSTAWGLKLPRAWTKISPTSLLSPSTRLLALEAKTTMRPSLEMETPSSPDGPFPWFSSESNETRPVSPVCKS